MLFIANDISDFNDMNNHSLTVVVTAYNEEKTIAEAITATNSALKKYVSDYEIIVVDDCSKDTTGRIADAVARQNPRVRVFHNNPNRNIGYNMRLGVRMARKEYCMIFVNADSYLDEESFRGLFSAIGEKEFVLGYLAYYDRHWLRKFISWAFVKIMNFLFGFHIHYYNGPAIVKTEVWRTVPMTTDSFAYMAEVVTTLLKRKLTYIEVPVTFFSPERKGVNLPMLRRNVGRVVVAIISLFWRLNIKKELYAP